MPVLWGTIRYEYGMAVRRWGVWLVMALAALQLLNTTWGIVDFVAQSGVVMNVWQMAGATALFANLLLPVIAGIAIADRLPRDRQLGTRELLSATLLTRASYVLGKYAGVLLAVLTPAFIATLVAAGVLIVRGAPVAIIGTSAVAFLAINLPAYLFVGAFSLACPAILPVRVYQVLFTGYWFWGNYLTPEFLPTLNGTLLTASGVFPAGGLFGVDSVVGIMQGRPPHTSVEAALNLLVLGALAAVALIALERYLAWQERRA